MATVRFYRVGAIPRGLTEDRRRLRRVIHMNEGLRGAALISSFNGGKELERRNCGRMGWKSWNTGMME